MLEANSYSHVTLKEFLKLYWLMFLLDQSIRNEPFHFIWVKGVSFWRNCGAASVGEWNTKIWFINGVDNVNWPLYRDWISISVRWSIYIINSVDKSNFHFILYVVFPAVDNEWKTRFETQQEMNNQLEKQVVLLRDKLAQLKIPSRDGECISLFFSVESANYLKIYNQFVKTVQKRNGTINNNNG